LKNNKKNLMRQKTAFSLADQSRVRLLICLIAILSVFEVSATINTSDTFSKKFQHKYGVEVAARIEQWQKLLQTSSHLTEIEKLILVNNFFNKHISFVSDKSLWGIDDYWATPLEILFKGAGDCEDFSIAKYFTLIKLGIPENKIRLTYVKALNLNQPHMVVTFSLTSTATPIILDNLIPEIKSANKRKDLLPIFSFNNSGVWLEKPGHRNRLVGKSSQINMWNDLRKRMKKVPSLN